MTKNKKLRILSFLTGVLFSFIGWIIVLILSLIYRSHKEEIRYCPLCAFTGAYTTVVLINCLANKMPLSIFITIFLPMSIICFLIDENGFFPEWKRNENEKQPPKKVKAQRERKDNLTKKGKKHE